MVKKQWLKGVGCLYCQSEHEAQSPDEIRVVLGGRTWVIKPNDDYEMDSPVAKEERQ